MSVVLRKVVVNFKYHRFCPLLKSSFWTANNFSTLQSCPSVTKPGPEAGLIWKQISVQKLNRTYQTGTMSRKVEAVLIDLSGTIHIDANAIPGAQEALTRLRASKLKVKFVTNTTKEPLRLLHGRLTQLGFDIQQDEIFTSLTAARNMIEAKQVRPLLLLEDCAKEDFHGISVENPNCVVVGLAPSRFDYQHMNQAFRLMLDGAPLIAVHKSRYFKTTDGMCLGPGPFVAGLEYATDTSATVVGKPEKTFFYEAIRDLQVDPHKAIMIGDDARDDVGGAMRCGMMGILVKTGKYRVGDEGKISPATAVCDDFPAAVDYILTNLHS